LTLMLTLNTLYGKDGTSLLTLKGLFCNGFRVSIRARSSAG
jgi:hypothetical protein